MTEKETEKLVESLRAEKPEGCAALESQADKHTKELQQTKDLDEIEKAQVAISFALLNKVMPSPEATRFLARQLTEFADTVDELETLPAATTKAPTTKQ